MKPTIKQKLLVTAGLFLAMTLSLSANPKPQLNKFLEPGSILIYEVNYENSEYLFIVRILDMGDDTYDFKWMFSHTGNQGIVRHSKNALENADSLYNFFSPDDITLKTQTSTIISEKIFNDLKEEKMAWIEDGDGKQEYRVIGEEHFYEVPIDSKYGEVGALNAITIFDEKTSHKLIIMDFEEFPLILAMNLGWTIELTAIL